jgi:hypothetical protein
VVDALNATFYYNVSGTWTVIGTIENSTANASEIAGSLTTSGLTDGSFTINATVSNSTGVFYAADVISGVIFDNTGPASNVTARLNGSINWGVTVLNSTATDSLVPIANVTFTI